MTPELIGILAVGATVIGLLLTVRRYARADSNALRAEFRAGMDSFRAEVRADVAALRTNVQALTERMSRVEGAIEGLFAGCDPRNDTA